MENTVEIEKKLIQEEVAYNIALGKLYYCKNEELERHMISKTISFEDLKKFTGKFITFKLSHCIDLDRRRRYVGEVREYPPYVLVDTHIVKNPLWPEITITLLHIQIKCGSVRILSPEEQIIWKLKY